MNDLKKKAVVDCDSVETITANMIVVEKGGF